MKAKQQDQGVERILMRGGIDQQVMTTLQTPGFHLIREYLRTKRREDTRKMIYSYRVSQNQEEIISCVARIKLIDELLAETDESATKLAGDILDHRGLPDTLYKTE